MGVRGLQTYLEQYCPSASPMVKISELVSKHRRNSTNEEIVIVVDGSSCIRHLYTLEWIEGGQLVQFAELAKSFVQAFADEGITLVFFFDGPTFEGKRQTWVERRYAALESKYDVLDQISLGIPTSGIPRTHLHLPAGLGYIARVMFETVCGCKVYQAIGDCDEEIAEYARTHEAFGILAQDTDFVILDSGDALYLSILHFNLKTMTTRLYDRRKLARLLGIQPSQLPLLATLIGNDIVPSQQLKQFHSKISGQSYSFRNVSFSVLFPNVARYIRSLPLDQGKLRDKLPEVARTALGSALRASDIETSLKSYETTSSEETESEASGDDDPWSKVMAEARRRHKNNRNPSCVFAVMIGLPFESSTSLEDFRLDDLPAVTEMSRPIRERIYGILLQEKPLPKSGEHLVPEWCMAGRGTLDEAKYVPAVPPASPHPGLVALWLDKGELLSVRWHLFVSSVCPDLHVSRVKDVLPPYLVIPTLLLFYINKLDCLETWEVDAMLATATCLKYYDAKSLAKLKSDPISSRGVRVANFIMRSTIIIYFLLASCGFPLTLKETSPWLYFDGKLFQIKFKEAKSKKPHSVLCDDEVDALQDFQLARNIVFSK